LERKKRFFWGRKKIGAGRKTHGGAIRLCSWQAVGVLGGTDVRRFTGGVWGFIELGMGTRVLLIEAGPTQWDAEGRITGSMSLPLTAEAIDSVTHLVDSLGENVGSVYRAGANEACVAAAKLIGKRFNLRPRDAADLEEVNMGLWEGLTREELKMRFPTVFPQWEANPLGVTPPDGEPVVEAIGRISGALSRIFKRNRGVTVALALRPMALQIVSGLVLGLPPEKIGGNLHQRQSLASMDVESITFKAA
jgi:broad specificity phosphatase PhoE